MSAQVAEIIDIAENLDERDLEIVLNIMRLFIPDDFATPDDISAHEQAMAEYERGEFTRFSREDWRKK